MKIDVTPMLMPEAADVKPLVGFDCPDGLFHVVLYDFGDGGAIGILRDGDNFCARIPLDSVADFWRQAKAQHLSGEA